MPGSVSNPNPFIFIIKLMSNTESALKKILLHMLGEKYPTISDIQIIKDEFDEKVKFKIFLGIKYNDLESIDSYELRDEVRHLSKYVLGKNESIEQVLFYNPDSN